MNGTLTCHWLSTGIDLCLVVGSPGWGRGQASGHVRTAATGRAPAADFRGFEDYSPRHEGTAAGQGREARRRNGRASHAAPSDSRPRPGGALEGIARPSLSGHERHLRNRAQNASCGRSSRSAWPSRQRPTGTLASTTNPTTFLARLDVGLSAHDGSEAALPRCLAAACA